MSSTRQKSRFQLILLCCPPVMADLSSSHSFDQTNLSLSLTLFMREKLNRTDCFGKDCDLFLHCWGRQSCDSCFSTKRPCAWCAISQTCVPNERLSFPFGILSPIGDENICLLAWRERWEMRAIPFSCRCSTMTLMSVV